MFRISKINFSCLFIFSIRYPISIILKVLFTNKKMWIRFIQSWRYIVSFTWKCIVHLLSSHILFKLIHVDNLKKDSISFSGRANETNDVFLNMCVLLIPFIIESVSFQYKFYNVRMRFFSLKTNHYKTDIHNISSFTNKTLYKSKYFIDSWNHEIIQSFSHTKKKLIFTFSRFRVFTCVCDTTRIFSATSGSFNSSFYILQLRNTNVLAETKWK